LGKEIEGFDKFWAPRRSVRFAREERHEESLLRVSSPAEESNCHQAVSAKSLIASRRVSSPAGQAWPFMPHYHGKKPFFYEKQIKRTTKITIISLTLKKVKCCQHL